MSTAGLTLPVFKRRWVDINQILANLILKIATLEVFYIISNSRIDNKCSNFFNERCF